jgi:aminocarboxymuconate-semialdehyde decarboxylase
MPSRREFIGQLAGAGVMLAGQPLAALQAVEKRREVMIGGRRIRTVDAHAHCIIPAVAEVVQGTELSRAVAGLTGPLVMSDERLKRMDEQGIDVEALTINPWWYGADQPLSLKIIDTQNRGLAALCAARPDRFAALATVALQHPEVAAEQLEDAFKIHKMRGVSLGASVNGEELAAARFDPFWKKAEELSAFIFIHPQGVPQLSARLQGNGFLANVIGNPLETTIALSHLIFEGTLDKFPGLRICGAHAGGFMPSYNGRFDQGCLAFPANCSKTLKRRPSEYLKQCYFDSMVFNTEGLRHLVAEYGSSHIVMGTDYPFPWTTTSVDHILNTQGVSDADRVAILGGNLVKLLGIAS